MESSTIDKGRGALASLMVRRSNYRVQQHIFVLTVLVPLFACLALFWVYPISRGFWGSFTQWRGFDPQAPFVGLQNYSRAIEDPIFRISLRNSFYYGLLTMPATLLLALLLALAVEASGQLRTLFRTIYFLPVVTSTIATALIWSYLYQPSLGLFNQLLTMAGLPTQRWLLSGQLALPSIAVYSIWKGVGFNMVIFMAGLTTIPPSFYDAAKVDGANRRQTFWHITLPLLRPTFVFSLVIGVIGSLQVFGPVYIMSGGGPNNATMVVAMYQWLIAFRELDLGYGSAMGMILFLIILALTLFQLRFLQARWEY